MGLDNTSAGAAPGGNCSSVSQQALMPAALYLEAGPSGSSPVCTGKPTGVVIRQISLFFFLKSLLEMKRCDIWGSL